MNPPIEATPATLQVAEANSKDVGRTIARLDPETIRDLGMSIGDAIAIEGERLTVCRAMPNQPAARGRQTIQLDGLTRANAGVSLDDSVRVRPVATQPATTITLRPIGEDIAEKDLEYIGGLIDGLMAVTGDTIRVDLFGSRAAEFTIERTEPTGPIIVNPTTDLFIAKASKKGSPSARPRGTVSYEDVGGLKPQLQRIREMVELPLRFPEVFDRLGIDAPKGVLLYGPPGTGKTLIARAIAHEVNAAFFTISGPEVIQKHYGESEAAIRRVWDEAQKQAPSIIFIDELDSIAPKRENVQGEVEKRVVAQLLALMDGLKKKGRVMVIAATNLPNNIDSALRRPGRFDREIEIPIPDRHGRRHILDIHARGMPLCESGPNAVDLDRMAAITHGCVGADLEALCREAAMACLRDLAGEIDFQQAAIPYDQLRRLEVNADHFAAARTEITPSAVREIFVESPDIRWEDIGGLDKIKDRLIEAVEWPLKHAELFGKAGIQPPKGVMLAGPPGVGKTMIAKAVATETEANFVSVKGPELLSKFVGESERSLREVFRKARQAAPCIIFFDEIDSLLPKRSSGSQSDQVGDRVMGQFLTELDGLEELKGVLILAATNRLDRLDPAILRPGRFDEIIEVGLPDAQTREHILRVHLRDRELATDVDIAELARLAEGTSGAQIASAVQRAAMAAVREAIRLGSEVAPLKDSALRSGIEAEKQLRPTAA